jgi:hypothetical protein
VTKFLLNNQAQVLAFASRKNVPQNYTFKRMASNGHNAVTAILIYVGHSPALVDVNINPVILIL